MDTENTTADVAQEPASAPDNAAQAEGTILGGAEGTAPENAAQAEAAAGVPESYDFSAIIPEGMKYDEANAAAFSEIAKECGLSQDQAAKIAAYGMQYGMAGVEAARNEVYQTIAGWGEAAKKELGGDFESTTAMAARGIRAVEAKVPGLKQMLNETGAGNRVEMIRLLAELGALTDDDAGHTGGTAGAPASNVYSKTNFGKYI